MTSLFDKIKSNSKITSEKGMKLTTFANSPFATTATENTAKTPLPILNIAYSGDLEGGVHENKLITIAGESKHYKSNLALLSVKGYLDKYPESLCIFFDSEFGISVEYMKLAGIDPERMVHIPITNIEELKFEIVSQLENLTKDDKVIFLIDSIGNLASKKEIDDALDEKSVADMTRAKALKGLFRMVTPYLALKNKSIIAINHVYESQGLFSKKVVSGGCVYAGTKVLMANGEYKAIETIKQGEFVQTLNGNKEVTHTWTPETLLEGTPETIELTFDDGFSVKTSLNHKFLTKENQWKTANELSINDECLTLDKQTKRLVSKQLLGKHEVYEITVKDEKHYILENGLVSHNTGIMYSSNIVFIIGRSQEKTGSEIDGYTFTINIDKSRSVKEKSKVSFKVMHNQGIRKYSGLLPIALESGHVIKVSNGWYAKKDNQEKRYRESQLETSPEFWESILSDRTFNEYIKQKFQYNGKSLDNENYTDETDDE